MASFVDSGLFAQSIYIILEVWRELIVVRPWLSKLIAGQVLRYSLLLRATESRWVPERMENEFVTGYNFLGSQRRKHNTIVSL